MQEDHSDIHNAALNYCKKRDPRNAIALLALLEELHGNIDRIAENALKSGDREPVRVLSDMSKTAKNTILSLQGDEDDV